MKLGDQKKNNGITLIALVVTIVVLLILAGITIGTLTGENGIINKSKEAKSNTEYDQWSEKIDLAIIDAEGNNRNADIDDVIEELKNKDIIDDASQVDLETGDITTNEPSYVVTDKLKDYISNVKITISKTPESEPSGGVKLKVESVEGIEGNIDLNTVDVNSLTEQEKKDMIKIMEVFNCNTFEEKNFTSFEEVLDWYGFENEEEYWYDTEENFGGIDSYLNGTIENLKGNNVQIVNSYVIVNQDNKVSDTYIATENMNYTFTIKEILTGKTYRKSVEVNNIDTNMPYYCVCYKSPFSSNSTQIYLSDKYGTPVEFQKAYIIYQGEKIDITDCVIEYKKSIYANDIYGKLRDLGKLNNSEEWKIWSKGTVQKIEIIKNGMSYFGEVELQTVPE